MSEKPAQVESNSIDQELSPESVLEALLFSSEEPLSSARLRDASESFAGLDIGKLTKKLNKAYEKSGRSFRVYQIAGGYQLFTLPAYNLYIEKLFARRQQNRLSSKALETLAIVAYKQPVTRSDIEEIRGVSADGVIKTLLSRNLITISGTATTPGNPYLYKTTRQFLEHFGLKSIGELPKLKELDEIVEADAELQEKIDPELLKELASEKLGLEEDGRSEDGTEAQSGHPEESERPRKEPVVSSAEKDSEEQRGSKEAATGGNDRPKASSAVGGEAGKEKVEEEPTKQNDKRESD